MHISIVLCCGAKRYCLPTSYQNVGIVSVIPTCLLSFKHFGKRVTQTCMPYCNVWAEVVYCGFPKSKVFTKTLICLFPARHQSLYLYQVSYVGACTPVSEIREFNQKKKNSEKAFLEFDTFSIIKKNPFFNQS